MDEKLTINADLIANGTVYANGPVYVMGMNIKKEIEEIKADLESLKQYKPEQIESVVQQIIDGKNIAKEGDKSKLKAALGAATKITDWAQRVQFWYNTIKFVSDPFLIYLIINLLKLKQ
jgi:hypothetical protein